MISKLQFQNFKSLLDVSFEPGNLNVFIGANGSGKSAILEALGVLSASITGTVDDGGLNERGVRLGTPALYKSSFRDLKLPQSIQLTVHWNKEEENWKYNSYLNNPIEKPKPAWQFQTETIHRGNESILRRVLNQTINLGDLAIDLDSYKGLFTLLGIHTQQNPLEDIKELYNHFQNYGIYAPNTTTLRGIQTDSSLREPLGLFGGGLAEAVESLLNAEDELLGAMELDEIYELLGWVGNISVGKPNKSIVSGKVHTPQKTIKFTDAFMKKGRDVLTPYDASEGSLHILFLLVLAMHPSAPAMFAVDNFDQALNPRLARLVTKIFSDLMIKNNKMAFITTHNPTTLDGLDLRNSNIRLFSVDRNRKGQTIVKRIEVTDELLEMGEKGYTLSRLWVMGKLGGVPQL